MPVSFDSVFSGLEIIFTFCEMCECNTLMTEHINSNTAHNSLIIITYNNRSNALILGGSENKKQCSDKSSFVIILGAISQETECFWLIFFLLLYEMLYLCELLNLVSYLGFETRFSMSCEEGELHVYQCKDKSCLWRHRCCQE